MKLRQFFLLWFIALLARGPIAAGQPAPQSIILASTTSVENSGLLAHILPAFTQGDWHNRARSGSGVAPRPRHQAEISPNRPVWQHRPACEVFDGAPGVAGSFAGDMPSSIALTAIEKRTRNTCV